MYRKFNNKIKDELIQTYCWNKTVFDIGSGVGGDLVKYQNAQIAKLYALEPDEEKIVEFKKRLPKSMEYRTKIINAPGEIQIDLKDVNITVSMFSMSFFFKSDKILNDFVNNIKGDYFIGTMLDGDKLDFKSGIIKGNFFEIKHLENNKISINLNDTPTVKGTQIEWISSFKKLVSVLEQKGYKLIDTRTFDTFKGFKELNPDEKKLLSMYRTFVFGKDSEFLELVNIKVLSPSLLVKKLYLRKCDDLKFIPALVNLESLELTETGVIEIHNLINLKKLVITNCKNLKKIYPLKQLKKLTCISCESLESVPDLESLELLELGDCDKINTVGSYKNLEELILFKNKNLKNVLKNEEIRYLEIHDSNATFKGNFPYLKELKCDNTNFLFGSETVQYLSLFNLNDTRKVLNFKKLKSLKFELCNAIIPVLDTLENLEINNCNNVDFIPDLINLKFLKCDHLPELRKFPVLKNLSNLILITCESLEEVSGLHSLEYLEIINCKKIKKIIGDLKELICIATSELKTITVEKLEFLKCSYCYRLEEIPLVSKELILDNCPLIETLPDTTTLTKIICNYCPNIRSISIYTENGILECFDCKEILFINVFSNSLEKLYCALCPNICYLNLLNPNIQIKDVKIYLNKYLFVPEKLRKQFNLESTINGILINALRKKK